MSKQKKEKKVVATERAIFDSPVKPQHGDIYKVTSMGVVIEFSDKIQSAMSAYKDAPVPKTMAKVQRNSGRSEKLYEQII